MEASKRKNKTFPEKCSSDFMTPSQKCFATALSNVLEENEEKNIRRHFLSKEFDKEIVQKRRGKLNEVMREQTSK